MIKIGGQGGRRPNQVPDNQGQAQRFNRRLEHTVAAANARATEAMKADGVPILLWREQGATDAGISGRTCSCYGGHTRLEVVPGRRQEVNGGSAVIDPLVGGDEEYDIVSINSTLVQQATRPAPSPITGAQPESDGDDDDDNEYDDTDAWGEEIIGADNEALLAGPSDSNGHASIDDVEAVTAMLAEDEGASSLLPPSLFGNSYTTALSVSCPVCAGSNRVDAWQPYGGKRSVFSMLDGEPVWSTTGSLNAEAKPNILTLAPGQELTFGLDIPMYFEEIIRVQPFIGVRYAEPESFEVEVNGAFEPVTPSTLAALSGVPGVRRFRLRALTRDMSLTHVDSIAMLAPKPVAQFPKINMAFEAEMLEAMTTTTIDVPPYIEVQAGNLISDFKTKMMWRVSNLQQEFTAAGSTLSTQVDLRRVLVTEMFYSLHPLDGNVGQGSRKFSGTLESKQS